MNHRSMAALNLLQKHIQRNTRKALEKVIRKTSASSASTNKMLTTVFGIPVPFQGSFEI